MRDRHIYSALAIAGVTPFVACALLPFFGVEAIDPVGPLDQVAAGYGLAIVSFLTGIHWATQIYELHKTSFNLLLASNAFFVAVWLAYVLGDTATALIFQIAALLSLLGIDRWLLGSGVVTQHYYRVRSTATTLATVSLILIVI